MKQLKYIYVCGFLITSMSVAMELPNITNITEGPVTTFPAPIKRFAITPDGEWLATSEDEREYNINGNRYIQLLLRIWKKKSSSAAYEETKSGSVFSPRVLSVFSPNVLSRDIKLHWLTDKRRIAVLAWAAQAVSIATLDASTFEAATIRDHEQESESANIDNFYRAHGEDFNAFTKSKGVSSVSIPMGTIGNASVYVQVTPTTIQRQSTAPRL